MATESDRNATASRHPVEGELQTLRNENEQLRSHIHDVERSSEISRQLVIEQFQEVDRILSLLEGENALRKSLLDATEQLSIIYADCDGIIRLFNRGAENLLGHAAADVVDRKSLIDFHDAAELEAIGSYGGKAGMAALVAFARDGRARRSEWSYFNCHRQRIPVNLSISPVKDQDGQVIGIVCSAMDISELKQTEAALRASEARYRQLSITDGLTQLFNKRYLEEMLEQETTRARRYHNVLSLLMMDIDDFKSYNDRYGHVEGDHVLATAGRIIRKSLRGTDAGFRYGGEEFVVLLPETGLKGAQVVAERIRRVFAQQVFEPGRGVREQRTLSIGAAMLGPDETGSALIRRADQGTYRAKNEGKDCVVVMQAGGS